MVDIRKVILQFHIVIAEEKIQMYMYTNVYKYTYLVSFVIICLCWYFPRKYSQKLFYAQVLSFILKSRCHSIIF